MVNFIKKYKDRIIWFIISIVIFLAATQYPLVVIPLFVLTLVYFILSGAFVDDCPRYFKKQWYMIFKRKRRK